MNLVTAIHSFWGAPYQLRRGQKLSDRLQLDAFDVLLQLWSIAGWRKQRAGPIIFTTNRESSSTFESLGILSLYDDYKVIDIPIESENKILAFFSANKIYSILEVQVNTPCIALLDLDYIFKYYVWWKLKRYCAAKESWNLSYYNLIDKHAKYPFPKTYPPVQCSFLMLPKKEMLKYADDVIDLINDESFYKSALLCNIMPIAEQGIASRYAYQATELGVLENGIIYRSDQALHFWYAKRTYAMSYINQVKRQFESGWHEWSDDFRGKLEKAYYALGWRFGSPFVVGSDDSFLYIEMNGDCLKRDCFGLGELAVSRKLYFGDKLESKFIGCGDIKGYHLEFKEFMSLREQNDLLIPIYQNFGLWF